MNVTPIFAIRSLFRGRALPSRRVLVVNGNPDPGPERFGTALADAYAAGSRAGGCRVRRLDLGQTELSGSSVDANGDGSLSAREVAHMLERIFWADRLFLVYPIWHGAPPPLVQTLFRAFAEKCAFWKAQFPTLQHGAEKPTRVVATASFPTFFYRPLPNDPTSRARVTALAGVDVLDRTLIGSVDSISPRDRVDWLRQMHRLGQTDRDTFSRRAVEAHECGP